MKKILLPLLLLFCVSDIQNSGDSSQAETLIAEVGFPMVLVEDNGLCKPTGVETVTYHEGKTEPAPEKKKTVAKTPKKKATKKAQPKKLS
jgi:hypothetical protein